MQDIIIGKRPTCSRFSTGAAKRTARSQTEPTLGEIDTLRLPGNACALAALVDDAKTLQSSIGSQSINRSYVSTLPWRVSVMAGNHDYHSLS